MRDERVLEQRSAVETSASEILETWCVTNWKACRMEEEEQVEIL